MANTLKQLISSTTADLPKELSSILQKSYAYSIENEKTDLSEFALLCQALCDKTADFFLWPTNNLNLPLTDDFDFFSFPNTESSIVFLYGHKTLTEVRNYFCPPVSFIGAGPGQLNWMTIEGKQTLEEADIVFYDALANPLMVASLPKSIECYFVGKRGDSTSFDQKEINRLIALHCRKGQKVVRLKGGDTGIFGRINEEIDELAKYQLAYTITPGISAMQSLPSQLGVFLTRRGMADRVTLCSGRKAGGAIADPHPYQKGTLVIYMGVLSVEQICNALIQEGYNPDMPAAIAVNLTRPGQKLVQSTLSQLPTTAKELNLRPPGLLIFGDAAAKEMQCTPAFSPLLGRRVLLGGTNEESQSCARELRRFGAQTIDLALFEVCLNNNDIKPPEFDDIIIFSAESANTFYQIIKDKEIQPHGAFITTDLAADATIQCLLRRNNSITGNSPQQIVETLQVYQANTRI